MGGTSARSPGRSLPVEPTRPLGISIASRHPYSDNIFVERLWRSVKYEEVYLKAYADVPEARRGIGAYLRFYNDQRPRQAFGYRTPAQAFAQRGISSTAGDSLTSASVLS